MQTMTAEIHPIIIEKVTEIIGTTLAEKGVTIHEANDMLKITFHPSRRKACRFIYNCMPKLDEYMRGQLCIHPHSRAAVWIVSEALTALTIQARK